MPAWGHPGRHSFFHVAYSRLERAGARCQPPRVKYLSLLAFSLLAGCATPEPTGPTQYTKLSVTDAEGDPVAEWIAEGPTTKTEQGYDIKAVERRTGPPDRIEKRYPNGRDTTVVGPNIILEKIEKPAWLKELDAGAK